MRRIARALFPAAVGGTALLGLWCLVKVLGDVSSFLLPWPQDVFEAAWTERRALAAAAWITGQGAVLGFVAAVALGFALALLTALSPLLRKGIAPYVLIVQMTPVIVLAPVLVLWLGQGLASIVAITFLICFFPVVANATLGFASTDRNLAELMELLGAGRWQGLRLLRIPSALPHLLTGARIAATLAPIGAITGDFLAGSARNGAGGIGFMTIVYFSQLKTAALFATGLIACILGFLFVGVVNLASWLLLRHWHESMRPPQ